MASVKYADRPVFFEVSENKWINLQHISSFEQSLYTSGTFGVTKQKTLITMADGSEHLFDGYAEEVASLLCGKPTGVEVAVAVAAPAEAKE